MIYAFKRRRVLQGCLAFVAIAILGGFLAACWFGIPADFWPLKALASLPALALGLTLPGIFGDAFAPGPILVISTEGLLYLPFSRETAPWSAIRNVTLTRAYSHTRGTSEYFRFKLMDGVTFVVADPKRFPVPPGGIRLNSRPIRIMTASVQASPQEIIDAVRACWRGGEIREVDDIPPGVPLPPDRSS